MNPSKNCIAIKSLLLLTLMGVGVLAYAGETVGTVTLLSGPLLAKSADGPLRVLAQKSAVEPGDTLSTQKKGYAQIRFSDNSQLILQPNTALTIDSFSYAANKPQADNIVFTLLRGGVRATAGLLGKRSMNRVVMKTPAANIDMQSATLIVQYREPHAESLVARRAYLRASMAALDGSLLATRIDVQPSIGVRPMTLAQLTLPSPKPGLAPGLYVQVLDGLIHVTNPSGTSNFAAGQFGYTASITQPPVVVPKNPGIQFTPPPAFNSSTGPTNAAPATTKSSTVDCEVR